MKRSHTKDGNPLLVGPLARVNINYAKLSEDAKAIAEEANIEFPCLNPFMHNIARAMELVHAFDDALKILEILDLAEAKPKVSYDVKSGFGAAVTEAPRGILYHAYKVDRNGLIEGAQIVTPTVHNVSSAEADLKSYIPTIAGKASNQLANLCNMLIRAYDFCLSCAVH